MKTMIIYQIYSFNVYSLLFKHISKLIIQSNIYFYVSSLLFLLLLLLLLLLLILLFYFILFI